MTVKTRTVYSCQHCGSISPKWSGQCPGCQAWNCLMEEVALAKPARQEGYAGCDPVITAMREIMGGEEPHRFPTGSLELDRVLGGGLVPGSVVLTGGSPGI